MPVRSPRRFYLINGVTVDQDDDPDGIDKLPGDTLPQTNRPVIARIKQGIGEFLGLEPLAWDDPIFTGVFGGEGLNTGATYRRVLGGFRHASYTLIAETQFSIRESFLDPNGIAVTETSLFRTVSIGFPKGHSVSEVIAWIATASSFSEIAAIRTPAGRRIDLFSPD